MNLIELKSKPIKELYQLAKELNISRYSELSRQDLILNILEVEKDTGESFYGGGVLEVLQDGYGFLRSSIYTPAWFFG